MTNVVPVDMWIDYEDRGKVIARVKLTGPEARNEWQGFGRCHDSYFVHPKVKTSETTAPNLFYSQKQKKADFPLKNQLEMH